MKKSTPKNQPVLPEKPQSKIPAMKLNSTNQVILAAIVVLLIFIVAVMSSSPKQPQQQATGDTQQSATSTQTASQESRSGQQVARISITRSDAAQAQGVGTTGGNVASTVMADIARDAAVAIPAGSRVKFKIDSFKKLAVQPLKFNVYDEYGKELTPDFLQTVNEHKLHMFVVSSNLSEYSRVFPEYGNGTWNVNVNLPNPGTYYAYVEMAPVKGGNTLLRSELTVREASKGTPSYPALTPNNLAISGNVSAVMNLTDAGLENLSTLMFSLTRDGKNVNDVRPYVGAFGSVTLFRHEDLMSCTNASPFPVIDESKGIFDFGAKFQKAGRYTAFAEFKVGDKVMVFPISFDVQ